MKIFPKIKIIGIGGAGGNIVSGMAKLKISGIEFIAINSDIQDLKNTKADKKLWIGKTLTQGLGTGMDPEIGKKAAEEQKIEIKETIKGAELLFLAAGFGGGTGSGATPVVAEIARSLGILTVAVVTKPFSFEGIFRREIAEEGIKNLQEKVDSLLIIENDKLLSALSKSMPINRAFLACDEILHQAVLSISDLILLPGLVNISFADIKSLLKDAGRAFLGIGIGQGEKRAEIAAAKAINSPLLALPFEKAKRVLFNLRGKKISLAEIDTVAGIVTRNVSPETRIIFGAIEDQKMKTGELKVIAIATGF